MTKEEAVVWNSLMSQIPVSLLRRADAYQLQILCECVVRREAYAKMLQMDPEDFKAHRAYIQTVQHIAKLSTQFGLSPIDRRRIRMDEQPEDEMEGWMDES